ncbi:23651_t:CDS:2, partial [Racocetra persica]
RTPQRWLSAMTLSTWYKEVSQIEIEAGIYKASQCSRSRQYSQSNYDPRA